MKIKTFLIAGLTLYSLEVFASNPISLPMDKIGVKTPLLKSSDVRNKVHTDTLWFEASKVDNDQVLTPLMLPGVADDNVVPFCALSPNVDNWENLKTPHDPVEEKTAKDNNILPSLFPEKDTKYTPVPSNSPEKKYIANSKEPFTSPKKKSNSPGKVNKPNVNVGFTLFLNKNTSPKLIKKYLDKCGEEFGIENKNDHNNDYCDEYPCSPPCEQNDGRGSHSSYRNQSEKGEDI